MMKTYLVGGAVRDMIMGLEPKDKDYVIVGATAEDVEKLIASGFQRVGADFPVFLHPETGDEYALARIERKVGVGYNGFEAFTSPDLTIEDDLRRRDLTINAMAIDLETNELIDPFGGREDLQRGLLSHVSEAFAEDPLRVLRVARFQARYGFDIDPNTLAMMVKLIRAGELDHLTRERIWVEMEKLFSEKHSIDGVTTLFNVGALDRLFFGKDIGRSMRNVGMMDEEDIEEFEKMNVISKFVKFSMFSDWTPADMQKMKIPREFQKAHLMHEQIVTSFMHSQFLTPEGLMKFIEDAELLKTSNTFEDIKDALAFAVNSLSKGSAEACFARIDAAVKACLTVDCAAWAAGEKNGKVIAQKIRNARVSAIWKNW